MVVSSSLEGKNKKLMFFKEVYSDFFRSEAYFLLILSAIEKKKNSAQIVMKKIVMTAFVLLISCIGVYG